MAGQQSQQPVGYQGGIPQYTATREQMPYQTGQQNELLRLKQAAQDAMTTGASQDKVREAALRTYGISPTQFDQAMKTEGTYRRPGQGGITYFSPIKYEATGKDLSGMTTGQTTGGWSDDQVASAIRTSLQQGYKAEDVLAKATQLGASADQVNRARAILQELGYFGTPGAATGTTGTTTNTSTGTTSAVIPGSSADAGITRRTAQSASPKAGITAGAAATGVTRSFGPNATPISQDKSKQIGEEYQRAGLPADPTKWSMADKQLAVEINNRVIGYGPYERLVFDPKTGGTDRPDPQVYSTIEPERKATVDAYLKTALPAAVEAMNKGYGGGQMALEKLMQDYRLSLDDLSKFIPEKDLSEIKNAVNRQAVRYKEPGRATYYGAVEANPPSKEFIDAATAALNKTSGLAPGVNKDQRSATLRNMLSTYAGGYGSNYATQSDMEKLGTPSWLWKYNPTYEDIFKAEASSDPATFWQNFARQKASVPQGQTLQVLDRVGGVPIYKPTNPKGTPSIGGSYGDVKQLQEELGFTPKEVIAAEEAYNKYGLGNLAVQIDPQIAKAVRDSIQAGYTMDQVYKGAQQNLGISKERVDQALKAMNMGGSDVSGADVVRMARENLPPVKGAAGGQMLGGIAMLSQGRYLKGNGDGVSDSIPARFAGSGQEARLADGEFVIPARVVSEIGNGSSDAGARKLYAMLDRVEARAKKSKRGKPSGADRELNKLA
jgi:hypothetical protein